MFLVVAGCSASKKTGEDQNGPGGFISFNDPRIQYEGRIGQKDNEAAVLYWPGTSVRLRFRGTGVQAWLEDYNGQNFYNVIVDNNNIKKIQPDSSKKLYTLVENLPDGEHTIELFKRTQINEEYNRGYTWLYGFQLDDNGEALPAPAPKKRRIEFYGNSITCGHAIEDTSGTDSGASMFENNYLSYAALTARHYQAQYSCIAVSGIGLLSGFRKLIMPEIYDLLNPFDPASHWDFSRYTPDVVVVNLLQNDEAVINNPGTDHFKRRFGSTVPADQFIVDAYKDFIRKIRAHYPRASIICALGSMGITRPGSKWPGLVEQAVGELHDATVFTHFFKYKGTPGHPLVKEQQAMADSLIQFIDTHINW